MPLACGKLMLSGAMVFRIAGVIAAIAIIFSLEYWLRVEWYIAVPLGMLSYLIVRYGAKRDRISN
jgi:hypothetical protein